MMAPDHTTFEYLNGRPHAPSGREWERAVETWRKLPTDEGASYDREVSLDASALEPMITYGTNPGMSIPIRGVSAIRSMWFSSEAVPTLSDLRQAARILKGRKVAPGMRVLVGSAISPLATTKSETCRGPMAISTRL